MVILCLLQISYPCKHIFHFDKCNNSLTVSDKLKKLATSYAFVAYKNLCLTRQSIKFRHGSS